MSPIRPEMAGRYPPDWPAISASIRHGRAGDRCECAGECGTGRHGELRCEARSGQPSPYTGSRVVLTVAHLDHDPPNVDPANLRAFCELCHNNYDIPHRLETRRRTVRAAAAARGQAELFPELEGT